MSLPAAVEIFCQKFKFVHKQHILCHDKHRHFLGPLIFCVFFFSKGPQNQKRPILLIFNALTLLSHVRKLSQSTHSYGVKFLAWKCSGVNFLTNIMSG